MDSAKKFMRIVARRHRREQDGARGRRAGTVVVVSVVVVVPEMFYLWIMFTTGVRGHRHSSTAHHHQIHSQAQTHDNCNTTTARLPAKVHLTSGRPWRGFPTPKLLLFGRYTTRPACTGALQTLCCNGAPTYLIKLLYKSRKLVKIKLLCLQRHVCDPIKHNNRQPIANHAGRGLGGLPGVAGRRGSIHYAALLCHLITTSYPIHNEIIESVLPAPCDHRRQCGRRGGRAGLGSTL